MFPKPLLLQNDSKAKTLITIFSVVVFLAVVVMGRYNLSGVVQLPFDVHLFATANAYINGTVAILLLAGLVAAKGRNFEAHKKIMLAAILLSVLFLLSYICHHLFAAETAFGDTDGVKGLSADELAAVGSSRTVYLIILFTHIPLAALSLPFILWSAYRSLTGEYEKHKKLVRIVWPVWFYVATTGVIIYWMIKPYYQA
jgi:putative membrane protein